jgi:ATP-dependent exoDNAse (exonuclease V) alpha subunit
MLKNYILSQLNNNLEYIPTEGQKLLLSQLSEYITEQDTNKVFIIKGYAGTGKTTIVNTLVKTLTDLKIQSVLLAPTGRAAKVLASYTGKSSFTIHKKIYRQQSGRDGLGKFVIDRNLQKDCFFIVDEASMIGDRSTDNSMFGTGDLLDDLKLYIQSGINCYLILIGDTAQLPPVGLDLSPALNPAYLSQGGLKVQDVFLSDVVRQSEESGILKNATIIRSMIEAGETGLPKLELDGFPDVERIDGTNLIEELENAYSRYGEHDTIVISRSNKRANRFNEGIRSRILWREEEISMGDLLMIVKNNYFWNSEDKRLDFIANGDIAEIKRIRGIQEEHGLRFANVTLAFNDYNKLEIDVKIMLDTLTVETASLPSNEQKEFFNRVLEDYQDEPTKKKRIEKVISDPFFNALQVKFAYAVTCHKAQGGQWKAVFIDPGYIRPELINTEYLRWLYTAFTRATEKLYLVNFPEEMF